MSSSTVSFSSEPRSDEVYGGLGAEFDEALRDVIESDVEAAAVDARRVRRVARLARLADLMSRADGSSATAAGREWARRKLVTELACATRRSERAAGRLIGDSERLVDDLPRTLQSLEAGAISFSHARVLISQAATVPEEFRAAFEEQVLTHAKALPAHRFDDRARRLRERLHPESIIVRTRAAVDERHVALLPECDGMATILHHLPAVDALAIDDLIDRTARATRADADPDADGRTHAQRRCDALTDLVLGRGDRPPFTPTVLVTIAASTLDGSDDSPANLHGYGPIDPLTARTLSLAAPTHLRVTPSEGGTTDITRHRTRTGTGTGRGPGPGTGAGTGTAPRTTSTPPENRYSASPVMRTALALLDETCRFPGCGRRAGRCELDHTRAWAEGGRTTPANLAHLCSRHHHLKHEGGWKATASRDGTRTLHWTSPRGATYTTTPENRALTGDAPDPPLF
jgi:hypothetical protein